MLPEGAYGRAPTCPECGRPVPARSAKLCPHCGYPLMFDSVAEAEPVDRGILRKPTGDDRDREPAGTTTFPTATPRPAGAEWTLGPHCPACGHRNQARRVRCEVCAHELWPGSAAPPERAAYQPPLAAPPPRRRRRWRMAAAVLLAVAVGILAAYLLSYAIG